MKKKLAAALLTLSMAAGTLAGWRNTAAGGKDRTERRGKESTGICEDECGRTESIGA